MDFNKAIVMGRVTRDPELKTTTSGKVVANLGVASNMTWNNKDGVKQEKVEFHNIIVWGKLAEICAKYLVKGQTVLFEGRLETRSWENKEGVKMYKTEIVAENMQMGQKPKDAPQYEEEIAENNAVEEMSAEDIANNIIKEENKKTTKKNKKALEGEVVSPKDNGTELAEAITEIKAGNKKKEDYPEYKDILEQLM